MYSLSQATLVNISATIAKDTAFLPCLCCFYVILEKIQLEKIAGALGVSEFALSDPDLDTRFGIMQALFYLEDTYGFTPFESENKLFLALPNNTLVSNDVTKWAKALTSLNNRNITQDEYDKWRYTYPQIEAERSAEKLRVLHDKLKE